MTPTTKGAVHVWIGSVETKGAVTAAMVNRAEAGGMQMDVVTAEGVSVTLTFTSAEQIHQMAAKMMQIAFEQAAAKGQG